MKVKIGTEGAETGNLVEDVMELIEGL